MKKLVQLSKKVSNSYFVTAAVLLVLFAAAVFSDFMLNTASLIDDALLYTSAKRAGDAGIIILLAAFGFYPYRRWFMYMKKKNRLAGNESISRAVIIWSNFHPVLAVTGFTLVFLHAYIFLKVVYAYQFVLFTLMGFISLLALSFVFVSGSVIKRKMQNRKLRRMHQILAALFILFFILHRVILMMNL